MTSADTEVSSVFDSLSRLFRAGPVEQQQAWELLSSDQSQDLWGPLMSGARRIVRHRDKRWGLPDDVALVELRHTSLPDSPWLRRALLSSPFFDYASITHLCVRLATDPEGTPAHDSLADLALLTNLCHLVIDLEAGPWHADDCDLEAGLGRHRQRSRWEAAGPPLGRDLFESACSCARKRGRGTRWTLDQLAPRLAGLDKLAKLERLGFFLGHGESGVQLSAAAGPFDALAGVRELLVTGTGRFDFAVTDALPALQRLFLSAPTTFPAAPRFAGPVQLRVIHTDLDGRLPPSGPALHIEKLLVYSREDDPECDHDEGLIDVGLIVRHRVDECTLGGTLELRNLDALLLAEHLPVFRSASADTKLFSSAATLLPEAFVNAFDATELRPPDRTVIARALGMEELKLDWLTLCRTYAYRTLTSVHTLTITLPPGETNFASLDFTTLPPCLRTLIIAATPNATCSFTNLNPPGHSWSPDRGLLQLKDLETLTLHGFPALKKSCFEQIAGASYGAAGPYSRDKRKLRTLHLVDTPCDPAVVRKVLRIGSQNEPPFAVVQVGIGAPAPSAPAPKKKKKEAATKEDAAKKAATVTPEFDEADLTAGMVEGDVEWQEQTGQDEHGTWATTTIAGVTVKFRWCPAGTFTMGSPDAEEGRNDDEVAHPVTLSRGFWLGEAPVTQRLWQAVLGDNPSKHNGEERPVERVSWLDCQRFLKRARLDHAGLNVRLPTEAEWEYACRARTTGPTWLGEPSAAHLDRIAWYGGNSGSQSHPVKEKTANPWGLFDMLGNVWEWCSVGAEHSAVGAAVDSTGPLSSAKRVSRGGSWNLEARGTSAAARRALEPGTRLGLLGFRLARGQ